MSDAMVVGMALAGLLAGVAALAIAVAALRRSALRSGPRRGAARGHASAARTGDVEVLGAHVDDVITEVERLRAALTRTLSRVATVRYDAFHDMGGQLSSSSALLDEAGNGVVITNLHGRSESRTYTKAVADGRSPHRLSEEEAEAVRAALAGSSPAAAAPHRAVARPARAGRR